ncbi:MAG: 4a-hydroxytetrahydrobiopterin dehydratase [Armatimonadota bacterium]
MTFMNQEPVPLSTLEIAERIKTVSEWKLIDKSITREFKFATFMEAIDFANKVARLADDRDHHPDICIYYNKVQLKLSTHKVGGLSDKDFELASAIDKLI